MSRAIVNPQHLPYLFCTLLLLNLFGQNVLGQGESQYDRGTPPQHAAGVSSFGSYISADLGTVNVSNGSLNMQIPLGSVGGRGFSVPLTLNYSSKVWSASRDSEPFEGDPVVYAGYSTGEFMVDWHNRITPGWTVGAAPLLQRTAFGIQPIPQPGACGYWRYLTKLTLSLPDKGEIELRDDYTDGAPHWATTQPSTGDCRWYDAYRGRRWHAVDGSGTVFITDNDNGVVNGDLAGWLITAEGLRFRFVNVTEQWGVNLDLARCVSILDRNGNVIQITYPNANEVNYTDQLGRFTKIQKNVNDPQTGQPLALLVTLQGFEAQPRYYKVKTGAMNQNYRAGIDPNLPVYTGAGNPLNYWFQDPWWAGGTALFPNSYCLFNERIDWQEVVNELILPNGRSLRFKYNQYGEVAELELPTGGKVQYDYSSVSALPTGVSQLGEVSTWGIPSNVAGVDRAIVARRTYPDGVTLEGSWSYEYQSSSTQVRATTNAGALVSDERHYFLPSSRYLVAIGDGAMDGTGYSLWSTGIESRTETRNLAGAVIAATENDWSQRAAVSWWTGYSQEQPANDNRINQHRNFLDTGALAKVETFYDQYNNPIEVKEYDFDQTLKRRTVTSYSSTNLVNGVNYADDSIRLLRLPLQQSIYDGASVEQARTIFEYDVYTNDGNHLLLEGYNAPPGSISGHDTGNYGVSKITRGNSTRVGRWIKTSNSYLFTYPRNDILGNVVSIKDPRGFVTTVSFADDFGDGSNPGSGANNPATPTYALATLITSPDPGNGSGSHTARSQYDFSTGLLTGYKDRNNIITQTIYDDPFNRPTLIKSALGIPLVENHTTMFYAPTTVFGITLTKNDVLTAKDQNAVGDAALRSWTVSDGFGRMKEAWSRDPQGEVKVITNYDALSRVKQVSNPFRPSLGETAVYTTTTYDLAGRVLTVTTPDNSVVTTAYSGNKVQVTDQGTVQLRSSRRSKTDALGRLTEVVEFTRTLQNPTVVEDPLSSDHVTSYSYDVLDHLTTATQGVQQRFFMYDSLGRLRRTRNPEQEANPNLNLTDPLTGNSQWCMAYEYDNNGNLTQETDARGVISTYLYDALNRNTTLDYSDTGIDPDITRVYDTATNGKGRLRESYKGGNETTGANVEHTKIVSYDALGRPLDQRQRFKTNSVWSAEFQTQRAYNRAGSTTSQTYPSGRTLFYTYDSAGRLSTFTGHLGDGVFRNYATEVLYSPFGGMTKEKFGTDTALYNKSFYNSRGQLSEIRVGTSYTGPTDTGWQRGAIINHYSSQCWGACNGNDNNGNLKQQDHFIPDSSGGVQAVFVQNYTYDSLNRLLRVQEGSWQQEFVYDRWGNRTIHQTNTWGTGINKKDFTVNPTNNRLGVPGGQSGVMSYDAAGNLTNDTYTYPGGGARVYDAENRMTKAWGGNNQWQEYTYNADGQRVRRKIDGVETRQIYGMDGELLAEYAANGSASSPQKEYGYRNGQLLVTAEPGTGSGVQNVTWTNVVGVSVSGNSLTKTAAPGWGNAGAVSTQTISSGDGYVETTAGADVNLARFLGLSDSDVNQHYSSIDFGLLMNEAYQLIVYESGTNRGTVGTYATGDKLRVAVEGGVVKYRQNGALLYTSMMAPVYPLLVDAALYSNNSTISTVVISGNLGQNVTWTNVVGVSVSGNSLTKTAPTGWGNAGAVSTQTIASGDGYVETTVGADVNLARFFGLSDSDTNQHYTSIDFGLLMNEAYQLIVYESGTNRGTVGTYTTGDKLRVAVEGGVVKYRRNGTLLYTSTVAPTYPLLVDTAMYSAGSTLTNVIICTLEGANLNWLVADQLGTPRMIFDKTGSLASTKRHDYLPFGEELFAGVGGRTTGLGYTGDTIRQQFTLKERDIETGLDYFGARYYASTQGRFISPDVPFMDQWESDPQSWNLYSYVRNNPLRLVDPTGNAAEDQCDEICKKSQAEAERLRKEAEAEGMQIVVTNSEPAYETFIREGLNPDKYTFEPPMGGGLRVAGSAGGSLLRRFFNWVFRRGGSRTISAVARPVTGQIFQRTLQTSKGPVDIIAEIVVEGDKLVLKDIAVYSRGEPLKGLTREMLAATSQLKDEARALGFKELQIIGERSLKSTSANPGHAVNVTIRLQ